MSRLFPYPFLSVTLLLLWLLLNQSLSAGHLILGAIVAGSAAWALAALQPEKPRMRNVGAILRLTGYVAADILRSNIAVGHAILCRREPGKNAGFLTIPLDLRNRYGLAVLACIITSTPGTIWVNYDRASGNLLIHVLDLVDHSAAQTIKHRYERLLLEIFP
jgi:multicomponent K+:H+ antiporter subunit E